MTPTSPDDRPLTVSRWRGMDQAAKWWGAWRERPRDRQRNQPRSWLADYQRRWLADDLIAGITLAAYAIPVSLAYAGLAGLPPQVGIYGYLLGGLGYALLGSSRQLAIGPTSAISLMIAATVGGMAAGDAAHYAQIASLAAFVVALLCLICWVLRLACWGYWAMRLVAQTAQTRDHERGLALGLVRE